jgi:hypothetical protein
MLSIAAQPPLIVYEDLKLKHHHSQFKQQTSL